MIEIQIDDELMIRSDKLNYTIAIPAKRKPTGGVLDKYQWNDKWFFGHIEHLIDQLVEHKLLQKDAKTMQEINENIIKTKDEILKAINKHEL
jgi:hypothetical protein